MCGIIFYNGLNSIPLRTLFNYALENKHRGEEDGFGYIDIENNSYRKTILTLEEVDKKTLDKERVKKLDKKDIEKFTDSLTTTVKELETETKCVLFHHRKASYGEVKLHNTHPIKVSPDISYVHNGSIPEIWCLRAYLATEFGYSFTSYTDTEVVGAYIENQLKLGIDKFDIYNKLKSVFGSFGVIMRYDKKTKELTVFKDNDRTLYLYTGKKNMLLISEPLLSLEEFDKCYRIDRALFTINGGKISFIIEEVLDVSDKIRRYLNKEVYPRRDYGCDNCKHNKNVVNTSGMKDYCLTCITGDKKLEGCGDKEENKQKKWKGKKDTDLIRTNGVWDN